MDSKYNCANCGKGFNQKGHYDRHLKNKNPCKKNTNELKDMINDTIKKTVNETLKETVKETVKEELSKIQVDKSNYYTVADFFCGAGGFSEGFHQAGYKVVFALDVWNIAIKTHEFNHPDCKSVCTDILKLTTPEEIDAVIPDTDIIIGSPPCVSFSNSNKSGKADKTLGVSLINQFLKIILHKKTKPNSILKYWVYENVPNSIEHIKDEYTAEELGLNKNLPNLKIPIKEILVASDYGCPQGRKRAIVGDYIPPPKTHIDNKVHIKDVISFLGNPIKELNGFSTINDPLFPHIKIDKKNLTDHFYDTTIPEVLWQKAKRLKTDHGFMGKMEFPDSINRPSRTIMATESYSTREAIIYEKEDKSGYRGPTIREISSLMGFPIDYQFVGNSSNVKHTQIGNAVCVQLSKALATAIYQNDKMVGLPIEPRSDFNVTKNLNDLTVPLFNNYKPNASKLSCKFHIHVPYIKIEQLRAQLDNIIEKGKEKEVEWICKLHKGSGKNATSVGLLNDVLVNYIDSTPYFNALLETLTTKFKGQIYDKYLFQIKNCKIKCEDNHLSPIEALTIISDTIKSFDIKDIKLNVPQLDELLDCHKEYPLEILYSLYGVNYIIELLNQ